MMRKTKKTVSILLLFMMLMQLIPLGAGAKGLEVYWGQDYPYDDESPMPGTVMFYHEAGLTNYEFTLYKDNKKVFSERIEEGRFDDSWWKEETLFLTQFSEHGSGSYHFTVSSLDGDGWTIDEAAIIETKTSGKFNYTKPSGKLAVPTVVSNKDGNVTWREPNGKTAHYMVDTFVEYANGETYDPDYTPVFYWDGSYSFDEMLKDTLLWLEEYDADRFPYNQATVKIRVRSLPEDIRDYQPSGYSDWIVVKAAGGGSFEEPEQPKPVDRSSVSKTYYDAAKIVYDLGIMPSVYEQPKKMVTRGEFAVSLVAILGLKETAKDLENTYYFTDVATGTELNGCINAVYEKGLISGTDAYEFSPDGTITYIQICKVLVDALGYQEQAENSYGGFPVGYATTAKSIGLIDGLPSMSSDSTVPAQVLAQFLANALEIKMLEPTYTMSGPVYKKTDKTLLVNYMGMELYTANVTFTSNNTKAKVTGKLYNETNLTGTKVKDKTLTVKDIDILNYDNKDMKLYVSQGNILCGFEYYSATVVLNNGEKTTTNPCVPLEFDVYGYTKYKMNDGEYKPIPTGTEYWLTDSKDGGKSVSFTFATEDESLTQTKYYSVTLDNKHTITYLLDGEVYKTQSVGYGKTISPPFVYELENRFGGWIGLPSTMPDYDITVSAHVLAEEKEYTGTVTYNSQPVSGAPVLRNGTPVATTDEQGGFSFRAPSGDMMLNVYYQNQFQTFCFNGEQTDLGMLELESATTCVVGAQPLQWVEGLDSLLTADDFAYAQTEGNAVAVQLSSGYASDDSTMDEYRLSNYFDYTEIAEMDITLSKIFSGETVKDESINETDSLLAITIPIPAESMGMADYVVLRKHGETVDALTTTPNADGECIAVGEDAVTVYTKKFSVYSVIGIAAHPTRYLANVIQENETVQVNVILPQEENEKAVLYVAFYGEGDTLLKAVKKADFSETNTFDAVPGTKEIKVFIWDDMMNPLLYH